MKATVILKSKGLADILPRYEKGDFVMYDHPSLGGDGTYYTGDEGGELWDKDLSKAKVLTASELREALEECDNSLLFRERFIALRVGVPRPSRGQARGRRLRGSRCGSGEAGATQAEETRERRKA